MQQALKKSIPPLQGKLQLVNADLNVVSISADDIPDWIKTNFPRDTSYEDIRHLTFFYHPEADTVVLNREHADADFYELLVTEYLKANDDQRQELKQVAPMDVIGTSFDLLDFVVAERRTEWQKN